jgi:hypothetical protein
MGRGDVIQKGSDPIQPLIFIHFFILMGYSGVEGGGGVAWVGIMNHKRQIIEVNYRLLCMCVNTEAEFMSV